MLLSESSGVQWSFLSAQRCEAQMDAGPICGSSIQGRLKWVQPRATKAVEGVSIAHVRKAWELGPQSGERRAHDCLIHVCKSWWQSAKMTEPGPAWWCPVRGQEELATNWNTGGSGQTQRKNLFTLKLSSTGSVAQSHCGISILGDTYLTGPCPE